MLTVSTSHCTIIDAHVERPRVRSRPNQRSGSLRSPTFCRHPVRAGTRHRGIAPTILVSRSPLTPAMPSR
jgi:hypothetical protein